MMTAIIIDDEPKVRKTIEMIVERYCFSVKIVGTAGSAIEGIKEINALKPDIVFLDIEMPHGSGFDLLESIPERNFEVIFITAYNQYAVKAFKYSAVDYILKPIDIEELCNAIKKVEDRKKSGTVNTVKYETLIENYKSQSLNKLAVPTTDGTEYVTVTSIIRIEADRSYSTIYLTEGKKMVVSKNLSELEELLNNKPFFRPHKSHIVNLEHIKKLIRIDGGYIEMQDGSKVEISRRKRDEFFEVMDRFFK